MVWMVAITFECVFIRHFHAYTVFANAVACVERAAKQSVPNMADAWNLFRQLVGGCIESLPFSGRRAFDRREGKTVHQFLFAGRSNPGKQSQTAGKSDKTSELQHQFKILAAWQG